MFRFPDTLDLVDLQLRPVHQEDHAILAKQLSDPEIVSWLAILQTDTADSVAQDIIDFSIRDDQLIRVVEFRQNPVGCLSLGGATWFWLDHPHRGQNLMTRVMMSVCERYFAQANPPLEAVCRADNASSIRLLSKMGFSKRLKPRRMFFQSECQGKTCYDFVLTPEQWHFLYPKSLGQDDWSIRPAKQRDLGDLLNYLPGPETADWPTTCPTTVSRFIETNRVRCADAGLFAVLDENRSICGFVLQKNRHHFLILGEYPERIEAMTRLLGDDT